MSMRSRFVTLYDEHRKQDIDGDSPRRELPHAMNALIEILEEMETQHHNLRRKVEELEKKLPKSKNDIFPKPK